MTSDLEEIARRVEAARGVNTDIDRCIQAALVGATPEWQEAPLERWAYYRDNRWVSIGGIRPYTASIDAAMALVPEGCGWRLWMPAASQAGDGDRPRVTLWGPARTYAPQDHEAATPALALTAAALRARAHLGGNDAR